MKSIRKLSSIIFVVAVALMLWACASDDDDERNREVVQTVVMFYPWSNTLTDDFKRNVMEFSDVVTRRGLHGERVLVCMATSKYDAVVFELRKSGGRCVADTLRRYHERGFTSCESMISLFTEIKTIAPAEKYGMIVGCHGMAWLPVDSSEKSKKVRKHYEADGQWHTRYFGGLTADSQIQITDFAQALKASGLKMEYLLFDACYMSSVEVAYELKDVADYLIACPTEIMSYGFPYSRCGEYLLGRVDYSGIAREFIDYYQTSNAPYATIAVTDCSQLDALAGVVRRIRQSGQTNDVQPETVQRMDGYTPTLFFDFGHYVSQKATGNQLLSDFQQQLDKTVVCKGHTDSYFSSIGGTVKIQHYSGLITSEPSRNELTNSYQNTRWYRDTNIN